MTKKFIIYLPSPFLLFLNAQLCSGNNPRFKKLPSGCSFYISLSISQVQADEPVGNSVPKISPIVPLWVVGKSGCISKKIGIRTELGYIWRTG